MAAAESTAAVGGACITAAFDSYPEPAFATAAGFDSNPIPDIATSAEQQREDLGTPSDL